jgi:hypothetical protein
MWGLVASADWIRELALKPLEVGTFLSSEGHADSYEQQQEQLASHPLVEQVVGSQHSGIGFHLHFIVVGEHFEW